MTADQSLLALRVLGQDHALESGRDYVLGSAEDCDLRVDAKNVAPHHARIRLDGGIVSVADLGSPIGTSRNGFRIDQAAVQVGDVIQFGDGAAVLVPDDGDALMVPMPALRAAATRRKIEAVLPTGIRRRDGESFQDMVAGELRRAPWLGMSAVLHALLVLLLWFLYPIDPPGGNSRATVAVDIGGGPLVAGEEEVRAPEVMREEQIELPIEVDTPPEVIEPVEVEEELPDVHPLGALKVNPRLTRQPPPPESSTRSTGNTPDLEEVGSAGFRKTVAQLKKSGLEIVFVFDSTGSMGMTIRDTKKTIAEMLDVLRALVPDARVGLVTYRDRGRKEEYVVQQLPLAHDFWHASNFVQTVSADGGGDRPEAVRDGLQAAFQQHWRPNSKRVVILAGDAPAHQESWRNLQSEVRAFASKPNSYVHAMVTSPSDAGRDTHEQFSRIAELGKGECLALDRHEHILQRVLDLAFGRQFDGDLAEVRKFVSAHRDQTATWALDLSRRGGMDLTTALREKPVDGALLNALVRMPKKRVLKELVTQLEGRRTPMHTRQAIAWVLQRALDLPVPPIEPISGDPPSGREMRAVRRAIDRLPR